MGSMISLSAGALDIDWGKNEFFIGYGDLFQAGDEGVNQYHYVGEDGTPVVEVKPCLRRPLHRIRPRLDLKGYGYPVCEKKILEWLKDEYDDSAPAPSLEVFQHALRSFDWFTRPARSVDFAEAIRKAYIAAPGSGYASCDELSLLAWEKPLDPLVVLRFLADMPQYADLPICWNFADVLEGGYVAADAFVPDARARDGWLLRKAHRMRGCCSDHCRSLIQMSQTSLTSST